MAQHIRNQLKNAIKYQRDLKPSFVRYPVYLIYMSCL